MQPRAPLVIYTTNACLSPRAAFVLKAQQPHLHQNKNGLESALVLFWSQVTSAILLQRFRRSCLKELLIMRGRWAVSSGLGLDMLTGQRGQHSPTCTLQHSVAGP